jgi:hypothetical protein
LEEPFGGGSALYIGTPAMGMIKAASEPNKSYLIDCTWVTLNLNKASSADISWYGYTDNGYTQIRFIGVWNDSYQHRFTGNSKITSIDLSAVTGIKELPLSFCSRCTALTTVKLPTSGLKTISEAAFSYTSIEGIQLPTSVETIDKYAFESCSKLKSIELPAGLNTIGDYSFKGCSNLKKIICNATTPPTSVGSDAFSSLPEGCVLYVPDAVVGIYEADGWTSYFSNIKPISEMPEDE